MRFAGVKWVGKETEEEKEEAERKKCICIYIVQLIQYTHRTDGSFWKYQHGGKKMSMFTKGKVYTHWCPNVTEMQTNKQNKKVLGKKSHMHKEQKWRRNGREEQRGRKHRRKLPKWIGKHTAQWQAPTNTHRKYAHGIDKSLVRWNRKQEGNTHSHIPRFATHCNMMMKEEKKYEYQTVWDGSKATDSKAKWSHKAKQNNTFGELVIWWQQLRSNTQSVWERIKAWNKNLLLLLLLPVEAIPIFVGIYQAIQSNRIPIHRIPAFPYIFFLSSFNRLLSPDSKQFRLLSSCRLCTADVLFF